MLENSTYDAVLVSTPGFDCKSIKTRIKLVLNKLFKVKFASKDYKSANVINRVVINNVIKDTKKINYELIKSNVLIIHSKNDPVVRKKVAIKMNKKIINSSIVWMGKSHFPYLDNAYMFYKVIESYANS